MSSRRTPANPVPVSGADWFRVVMLAFMSLTIAVGAVISDDLAARVGFVFVAIAVGAAALWTPWRRRHGVARTPPVAPTTTAAQRRSANVTLAVFFAVALVVQIVIQPTDPWWFVIAMIGLPVSSVVAKLWPEGRVR